MEILQLEKLEKLVVQLFKKYLNNTKVHTKMHKMHNNKVV